jgi:hypothetical protein
MSLAFPGKIVRMAPKKFDVDDFDTPPAEWKIATLDDGAKPRTPPACSITGRSQDSSNYCYPLTAKISEKLKFQAKTTGQNCVGGDKIRLRVVKSGTKDNWSDDVADGIDLEKEYGFTANDGHKLNDNVSKMTDLRFDFVFDYTNSKGEVITLGRQSCSKMVVYVVVSQPQEPWGLGTAPERQKPWVELLEKICTDWAKGAKTVEQAAGMIVGAVNNKMTLAYDTVSGADRNGLVVKDANFKPISIRLRAFLGWLEGDPKRKPWWNIVNCTCCGALLSTIANCVGCSLNSSVLAKNINFSPGFGCQKIISIGYSAWHHPFYDHYDPADTVGGFSYHEVAWTGSSGSSDQIYDACLQVAKDPVSAPEKDALFAKGMTFATTSTAIDDYRRRLVIPTDVSSVDPITSMAGRYKAE